MTAEWMPDTQNAWRVEVHWEDSTIPHRGWREVKEILADRKAVRCMSVGFVLADDEQGMVLTNSIHGSEAAGVVMIPRSAIRKVRKLR